MLSLPLASSEPGLREHPHDSTGADRADVEADGGVSARPVDAQVAARQSVWDLRPEHGRMAAAGSMSGRTQGFVELRKSALLQSAERDSAAQACADHPALATKCGFDYCGVGGYGSLTCTRLETNSMGKLTIGVSSASGNPS